MATLSNPEQPHRFRFVLGSELEPDPHGREAHVVRLMDAREDLGTVLRPQRQLPLWARVAGDLVDAALVAVTRGPRAASGVVGIAALDVIKTQLERARRNGRDI